MFALRLLSGETLRVPQLPLCHLVRTFLTSQVRMEELKTNRYYAKYAERLKQKQEEDPEEFESKVNSVAAKHKKGRDDRREMMLEMEAKRREEASQLKPGHPTRAARYRHQILHCHQALFQVGRSLRDKHLSEITLDSLMKVDLIKDKNPKEINQIWTEYHKDKKCIFAVIKEDEYVEMCMKLQEFGTFIYPMPRGQGYEFFLQQKSANTLNFTPLIQYQTRAENAPIALTITHYEELMKDQGIVLMRGEPDTSILTVHEAQLLALQVKMYYGLQSGLKFNQVRLLNTSPDSFRHLDLIKQFENFKKDALLAAESKLSKEVD